MPGSEAQPRIQTHISGAGVGTDLDMLRELRRQRRASRASAELARDAPRTFAQSVADTVTSGIGSWRFVIAQSAVLAAWVAANLIGASRHWDPYPFILLNLALSFQAAYAAPFVMMSQNRQSAIDRRKLEEDYRINIKAELEIEHLHQKIDEMREREILSLSQAVEALSETLTQIEARQNQRALR